MVRRSTTNIGLRSLESFSLLLALILVSPSTEAFSSITMMRGGATAAKQIALKIGLNVVPTKKTSKSPSPPRAFQTPPPSSVMQQKGKKNRPKNKWLRPPPPQIVWDPQMEDLFWKSSSSQSQSQSTRIIQRIENDQSFPLLLLPGILSPELVEKALSIVATEEETNNNNNGYYEEMEQHELKSGKVRALRRSLVSQLDPNSGNSALWTLLQANLPGQFLSSKHHPFEDASVVSYRYQQDFYEEHHDSYDPSETKLRSRQRAYTVLVYLRTPPGPPTNGGTAFPKLTQQQQQTITDRSSNWVSKDTVKKKRFDGVIVKPQPGDILMWPNFDRHGMPDPNSIHCALPVQEEEGIQTKTSQDIGKTVINLWWEGFLVPSPATKKESQ